MLYLILFACAIALGWALAVRLGGTAERETMCLLSCVWLATIAANLITQDPAPYKIYAILDFAALFWLFLHQRRNWQWLISGLFACMMLTHVMQWAGAATGVFSVSGRPYQDFLAVFGYLQIVSVGWASYERDRLRRNKPVHMGGWVVSGDWVLFGS